MSAQRKYRCRKCSVEVLAGPYIAPELCSACQLAANAKRPESTNEITPEMIYRVSELHRTIKEQAAEIERLREEHEQDQIKRSREFESRIGNYPLKSIQQKDSEIERLKKAIEDANLAGFKEGFNSAENQLAELKADNERLKTIITSNLHERTCHECGKLEWTTKNIGHLHTCDECYLKFLGRLRGT